MPLVRNRLRVMALAQRRRLEVDVASSRAAPVLPVLQQYRHSTGGEPRRLMFHEKVQSQARKTARENRGWTAKATQYPSRGAPPPLSQEQNDMNRGVKAFMEMLQKELKGIPVIEFILVMIFLDLVQEAWKLWRGEDDTETQSTDGEAQAADLREWMQERWLCASQEFSRG